MPVCDGAGRWRAALDLGGEAQARAREAAGPAAGAGRARGGPRGGAGVQPGQLALEVGTALLRDLVKDRRSLGRALGPARARVDERRHVAAPTASARAWARARS